MCENLKETLNNILLDNEFMCNRIIAKINILRNELEHGNVENVTNELTILFDRMETNISSFRTSLTQTPTTPTNSMDEEPFESDIAITQNDSPQLIDNNNEPPPPTKKLINLSLIKKSSSSENLNAEIDLGINTLVNLVDVKDSPVQCSPRTEVSGSFDFDTDRSDIFQIPSTQDVVASSQELKQNDELLLLLTKVTNVNEGFSEEEVLDDNNSDQDTNERAGAALALLDSSDQTDSDLSDESQTSSTYVPSMNKSTGNSDSESENERSDNIENKEIPLQSELRDTQISITRLEDLNDEAINRLCNLNNINKRKLVCSVKLPKVKRMKLLLPIPSSSSSSDQSGSESDSETDVNESSMLSNESDVESDLKLDRTADEEALADLQLNMMSESECDSDITDIENSSDEESDRKKKLVKKKGPDERKSEKSSSGDETDIEPVRASTSAWKKNDPILNLRISSDSDSESVKSTKSDNKENKIEDSDDDIAIVYTLEDEGAADSDVEFIMEQSILGSSSPTKGRKNIREIISDDDLTQETQQAKEEENKRIQRLEELAKSRETVLSQSDYDFVLDVDVQSKQPLVTVDPNLSKKLKPHQRDGVQFMWDICYESVKMCRKSKGTGCILAHSMGLGKTLQVITLIHALFCHPATKTSHVLIVCPLSTVTNWQREFKEAFDLVKNKKMINVFPMIKEDFCGKLAIVNRWQKRTGVLIMGYEAFEILTNKVKAENTLSEEKRGALERALVKPGPGLIVCDEGHILKNNRTKRTRALMTVETKRRIVLTGTPLQNNLLEYYFMVQFVKPNLLGTYDEYRNRFANPIMNGQYFNSTPEDIKLMKKRTHVLTKVLKKTINRVESRVLEQYLPEIYDYTVFVTLHPLQQAFYKLYIDYARNILVQGRSINFLSDFIITKLITLHPRLLEYYCNKKMEEAKKENDKQNGEQNAARTHKIYDLNQFRSECFNDITPPDIGQKAEYGTKMAVIMAIIDEVIMRKDKLLIFSSNLMELDCIEYFLTKFGSAKCQTWALNKNYYRMDGSIGPVQRSELCAKFNNPVNDEVKVFLISYKVGSLGLNLTAANRVILIGSNFNPSYDTQSVYRVYRFGQTKSCYVYRILSIGTMEEKIYRRCIVKLALAGTVIDKMHIARHFKAGELEELYLHDFNAYLERPLPAVPQDTLLATLLQSFRCIYTFHEHDALLKNRPEEELNDEDKKLAWEEFTHIEENQNNVANAGVVQLAAGPAPIPQLRQIAPQNVVRNPVPFGGKILPSPANTVYKLGGNPTNGEVFVRNGDHYVRLVKNPPRYIPPNEKTGNPSRFTPPNQAINAPRPPQVSPQPAIRNFFIPPQVASRNSAIPNQAAPQNTMNPRLPGPAAPLEFNYNLNKIL